MDLKTALGLEPGELVAFVGAGGKTTAAWRLLRLFVSANEWTVFTTTTQIFEPQKVPLLLSPDPDPAAIAQALLAEFPALFVAAGRGPMGDPQHAALSPYPAHPRKLVGLGPELVTDLARRLPQVTWLVEADGAKGRLIKAPAEHEPVVPGGADYVIIVASLDGLGKPLDERTVHRPERAATLLRVSHGTALTPQMLAQLITHPEGGLKGIPHHATAVALLTQSGTTPHPQAQAIAAALHRTRIRRVVLADLRAHDAVLEVWK